MKNLLPFALIAAMMCSVFASCENIYEEQGVEISYIGNSDAKLPGNYTVTAIITYEELKVQKRAVITITKLESVLTAETEQVVYLSNNLVNIVYSLNNDKINSPMHYIGELINYFIRSF